MKKFLLVALLVSFTVGLYISYMYLNPICRELSDRTTCQTQESTLKEFKNPEYQIKTKTYNL